MSGLAVRILLILELLVVRPRAGLLEAAQDLLLIGVIRDDVVDERICHGEADLLVVDADEDVADIIVGLEEVRIVDVDTLDGVVCQLAVHDTGVTQRDERAVQLHSGLSHGTSERRYLGVALYLHALTSAVLDDLHEVDEVVRLEVGVREHSEATVVVDLLDVALAPLEDLALVLGVALEEVSGLLATSIIERLERVVDARMLLVELRGSCEGDEIVDGQIVLAILADEVDELLRVLLLGLTATGRVLGESGSIVVYEILGNLAEKLTPVFHIAEATRHGEAVRLHDVADLSEILAGDDDIRERLLQALVHLRECDSLAAYVIEIDGTLGVVAVLLDGVEAVVSSVVKVRLVLLLLDDSGKRGLGLHPFRSLLLRYANLIRDVGSNLLRLVLALRRVLHTEAHFVFVIGYAIVVESGLGAHQRLRFTIRNEVVIAGHGRLQELREILLRDLDAAGHHLHKEGADGCNDLLPGRLVLLDIEILGEVRDVFVRSCTAKILSLRIRIGLLYICGEGTAVLLVHDIAPHAVEQGRIEGAQHIAKALVRNDLVDVCLVHILLALDVREVEVHLAGGCVEPAFHKVYIDILPLGPLFASLLGLLDGLESGRIRHLVDGLEELHLDASLRRPLGSSCAERNTALFFCLFWSELGSLSCSAKNLLGDGEFRVLLRKVDHILDCIGEILLVAVLHEVRVSLVERIKNLLPARLAFVLLLGAFCVVVYLCNIIRSDARSELLHGAHFLSVFSRLNGSCGLRLGIHLRGLFFGLLCGFLGFRCRLLPGVDVSEDLIVPIEEFFLVGDHLLVVVNLLRIHGAEHLLLE